MKDKSLWPLILGLGAIYLLVIIFSIWGLPDNLQNPLPEEVTLEVYP